MAKNIHVTDVEPGLAETEFSEVRFKGDKDRAAAVDDVRLTPDDVADVFCGDLAGTRHQPDAERPGLRGPRGQRLP